MHPPEEEDVEWKKFSTDFDPDVEIELLDEDDDFEMIHDSEL